MVTYMFWTMYAQVKKAYFLFIEWSVGFSASVFGQV